MIDALHLTVLGIVVVGGMIAMSAIGQRTHARGGRLFAAAEKVAGGVLEPASFLVSNRFLLKEYRSLTLSRGNVELELGYDPESYAFSYKVTAMTGDRRITVTSGVTVLGVRQSAAEASAVEAIRDAAERAVHLAPD